MDADVPTIAAVDGPARAGGIGLMAACDLVVVRGDLTFALTEVRIGVAAAIIAVPILRRTSASSLAAAFLTGETVRRRARPPGRARHPRHGRRRPATVATLCAGVAMGAPAAVAATKRLLREVPTLDRSTAFDRMRALSDELFAGARRRRGHGRLRREAPAPLATLSSSGSPIWAGISPPVDLGGDRPGRCRRIPAQMSSW